MDTAVISHSACLYHDTPFGHPECADRLRAVLHALEGEDFLYLQRDDAPRADRDALERVHAPEYLNAVSAQAPASQGELVHLDPDTVMSAGTLEAAHRAAGACIAAVDGVASGRFRNAFCAVRPPGHHAERDRAMGFCLFNNVAVAAEHARAAHGWRKVAIVDFDVHHGNGGQEYAYASPDTLYASAHEARLYPHTGHSHETGPADNVVNSPVPAGADGPVWRGHMERDILPAVDAFDPDLIIISAGFDAHREDPLANLQLTESDFAWATRELASIADRRCGGRLVSSLEGGYDLDALARSAAAHVRALMEA